MNPVSICIKIGKRIRSSKCRPCWVLEEPFTRVGAGEPSFPSQQLYFLAVLWARLNVSVPQFPSLK